EVGLVPKHSICPGFESSIRPLVYETLKTRVTWTTSRQLVSVSSDLQPLPVVQCRIRERFAAEDSSYSPRINPHAHAGFLRHLNNIPDRFPVEPKVVLTECVHDDIETFIAKSPDIHPDVAKNPISEITCRNQHGHHILSPCREHGIRTLFGASGLSIKRRSVVRSRPPA